MLREDNCLHGGYAVQSQKLTDVLEVLTAAMIRDGRAK
jgi:hypothetical protein